MLFARPKDTPVNAAKQEHKLQSRVEVPLPICIFFYPGCVFWGPAGSVIVITHATLCWGSGAACVTLGETVATAVPCDSSFATLPSMGQLLANVWK